MCISFKRSLRGAATFWVLKRERERVLSYIDNQRGEPSLRVGKNKILSLEAVNKTPIISRKLNTMKGKIDKVPPSVNSRRDRLIRIGTGPIHFTETELTRP